MAFIHAASIYCAPRTPPRVREAGDQDIHLSPSLTQVGWGCCLLKKQYSHVLSGKEIHGGAYLSLGKAWASKAGLLELN